ncbi:dehydrodolichyl diphosphate synthase complex subunit nus1 [Anopheles ziemanni]|nr:dehydrodolichyl diphosphate synthase complex subunit nus1 isoform X2 [Anopheles coustani]XP_058176068.1 dehydrodolichyl diphosphate synthase complex subunit nus1 [Anopheles ziemanni]
MNPLEWDEPVPANVLVSALWSLLHTLYSWIEYLSLMVRWCHKVMLQWSLGGWLVTAREKHRLKQSQLAIKLQLQNVDKVPKHLVVVLGPEEPNYTMLSNYILWAYAANIEYVSFYDHNGLVKRNHEQIMRYVWDVRLDDTSDKLEWSRQQAVPSSVECFEAWPRSGRRTVVAFFSPEDGKPGLVNLSRSIGVSVRKRDLALSEVNIDYLDRQLQAAHNHIPDPDLAIYFGNICSTYGLLPWQIRLTEFLPLERRLRDSNEQHFVNCLLKYGKCEQRIGT